MIPFIAGSALRMAFGGGWFLRALANLGSDFRALFAWLTTDAWKFLFFGSLVLFGIETLRYHSELRHSAKLEKQLTEVVNHSRQLQSQLDAISTAKNQQKVVTQTKIEHVTKILHEKELIAQKIEQAPDAPECRTPTAILQADL